MRRIRWSDNICTVGWTCIHAFMNAEDMHHLLAFCPEGTFSITSLSPWGVWKPATPQRHTEHFGEKTMSYYFRFPEDDRGTQLIRYLQGHGMGQRGESC